MPQAPADPTSGPPGSIEGAPPPRTLVVGLGGIGGTLAVHLLERGARVFPVTTNSTIEAALRRDGYRLTEGGSTRTVRGPVFTAPPETEGPFDFILFAVQPPAVEAAAVAVSHLLSDDGAMVCLQNGLCERRIAAHVGGRRVIGAVVAFGASMASPGCYERTSRGGLTIGPFEGAPDVRCRRLGDLLASLGHIEITDNLLGARWSKLAVNCAISSLGTIGGSRLGELLLHRFVRRLALEVMTEAILVARAEGVRLERLSSMIDLDQLSLTPDELHSRGSMSLVRKHTILVAAGLKYRRLRSSMLNAIERGRPPAVDFLNGEVVDAARRHGIACPVNESVRATIHRIALGKERPGLDRLRAVYDETRSALRAVPCAGTPPS